MLILCLPDDKEPWPLVEVSVSVGFCKFDRRHNKNLLRARHGLIPSPRGALLDEAWLVDGWTTPLNNMTVTNVTTNDHTFQQRSIFWFTMVIICQPLLLLSANYFNYHPCWEARHGLICKGRPFAFVSTSASSTKSRHYKWMAWSCLIHMEISWNGDPLNHPFYSRIFHYKL